MAEELTGNAAKLAKLIGFDPSKRQSVSQEIFGEVVKEIADERVTAAKLQAKEFLVKAIELRNAMSKARKEFFKLDQKFEKDLGKVLNSIEGMLSGKEEPEQNQENTETSQQNA